MSSADGDQPFRTSVIIFKRFQWIGNEIHWINPANTAKIQPIQPIQPKFEKIQWIGQKIQWIKPPKPPKRVALYPCVALRERPAAPGRSLRRPRRI